MTINFNPAKTGTVNLPINGETGDRQVQRTRPDQETRIRAGTLSDSVSITKSSHMTRELEQRLANIPVVDSVRVEAFRKSIAQGNYRVDTDMLAANLLELETALAHTKGGKHV